MTVNENTTPQGESKRREILAFIASHYGEHGYPPSIRQIGAAVGLNSTSTVQTHIDRLVAEGRITRAGNGSPRTLRLVVDNSPRIDTHSRVVAARNNVQAVLDGKLPPGDALPGVVRLLDQATAWLGEGA